MSLLTYTYSSLSNLLPWLIQRCNIYQIHGLLCHYYPIFISVKIIEHLRDEEWAKTTAISAIILSFATSSCLYRTYFPHFKPFTESVPDNNSSNTTISSNGPFLAAIDTKTLDLSHLISDGAFSEHEILLRKESFGSNVLYHNRDRLQVFFTFCKYSSSVINEARVYAPSMSRGCGRLMSSKGQYHGLGATARVD